MGKVRWGILGCGKIAKKFADDLRLVKEAELVAVGAREFASAQAFASHCNVPFAHGSYLELVQNPALDVIYIATPHSLHYEHGLLCLRHKKAALIEKAFTINAWQAKELVGVARENKVFLMEAFWTRFLPHYLKTKEMIAAGKVGNIQSVIAEFGFKPTPPVAPRIYDPTLGGGSLLDVGVYPVFLTLDILGKPDTIHAWMSPAPTGIDNQCSIQFKYNNGAMAQLFSSFSTNLATGADISGDGGRIRMTHRFHGPTTELEYYPGIVASREVVDFEKATGNGYEYEARHVTNCIKKGLLESPLRTHADTILLMEILDEIRKSAGINYPEDV
ncbi:MAG: Gfo/Idh/MocA family protein [Cytophagales bacterium]